MLQCVAVSCALRHESSGENVGAGVVGVGAHRASFAFHLECLGFRLNVGVYRVGALRASLAFHLRLRLECKGLGSIPMRESMN